MNNLSEDGFKHHLDNIEHQSYVKACWKEHQDMVEVCDKSIEYSKSVLRKFYDSCKEKSQ